MPPANETKSEDLQKDKQLLQWKIAFRVTYALYMYYDLTARK